MSHQLRSSTFFLRSTALVAFFSLSCLAVTGCGGGGDDSVAVDASDDGDASETGDSTVTPDVLDSSAETTDETSDDTLDSTPPPDSGVDSATDTTDASDTSDTALVDSADSGTDSGPDSAADTGPLDSGIDTSILDTGIDTAVIDTGIDVRPDTGCTIGTACAGGQVCQASTGGPTCQNCTSDTQCAGATSGTICVAGTCQTGACVPKNDATRCTGAGPVNCCATATTIGACVAPVSGKSMCCADSDCGGSGVDSHCDTATHTCQCPAPTPGTLYVAPEGSDVDSPYSANGSQLCPFKTAAHAISKVTSTSTTIVLQRAKSGAGPTIYGSGCTGGVPCDATPIVVPNTVTGALLIEGNGTSSDVVVTGDGNAVFAVNTPFTGFLSLSIVPTKKVTIGGPGVGGHGIVFDHAGATGTVSNVTIRGTTPTATIAGTGEGIWLRQTAALPLGSNVIITQMLHGVLVNDGASARLTGASGASIDISNTGEACIRVASSTAASISTSGAVTLRDCAGAGALVIDVGATPAAPASLADVLITKSALFTGSFDGIHLLNRASANVSNSSISVPGNGMVAEGSSSLSVASTTIDGSGGAGIRAQGSAKLTIAGGVKTTNGARGVVITNSATANIDGLTSTGNGPSPVNGDGLSCDSSGNDTTLGGDTIKLRNSSFLLNSANGVVLNGICLADLGSGGVSGNTFNTATQKNTLSGLCYLSGANAVAVDSRWACLVSPASGCTSGTPKQSSSSSSCQADVDITNNGHVSTPPPQECCN